MRFSALGDIAVVAELGGKVSPVTLQRVRHFARAVERARIAGVTDVVPSYTTVTVFYDAALLAAETQSPHAHLSGVLAALSRLPEPAPSPEEDGAEVCIPVCYGGESGPDLAAVAAHAGLAASEVIALHTAEIYRVHAIGFTPGFPYLGGLPEKLHTPRRAEPRARVPAGAVGIGGAQTGIYPLESPGGWQLIGRTPVKLFDATRIPPALLHVGDRVKFQSVSLAAATPAVSATAPTAPIPATVKNSATTAAASPLFCHLLDDKIAKIDSPGPKTECHLLDDKSFGIQVRHPGMFTTVQDLGRSGHRASGVPQSGAADAFALRVANLLVGNAENAAALELTLLGPELEFSHETVIAIGGAGFSGLPSWRPLRVEAGARLKIGAARTGCRGYLAVAGGFVVEPVLGSASTCLRGGFGGYGGRALREGDELRAPKVSRHIAEHWRIDERILPLYSNAPTVRVVRGAQADEFGGELLVAEFKVTPQADRMGVRLSGPELARANSTELLSTAVAPGTVQVPPNGQPIVLLADAQTIGGYPQIAHVITVDLPLVAQLKPGDHLRFREVSLEEAVKLLHARERALGILHEGLAQKFS